MGCSHPQTPPQPTTINHQGKVSSETQMNPKRQIDQSKPSDANIQKKEHKQQKQIQNSNKEGLDRELNRELDIFIQRIFLIYDTNKSGFLQMNEFSKLLRDNIYPEIVTDQEAETFLKIADLNKNRIIEKKQLLTLFKTLIKY